MESNKEKSDRYYAYLACKRKHFINSLTRVGAKLVNLDNDYDVKDFLKEFVPQTDFLEKKIAEKARESQTELVQELPVKKRPSSSTCLDSQLIQALQAEFKIFEKDFQDLLKKTDPEKVSSCGSSSGDCSESLAQAKPVPKTKQTVKENEVLKESPGIARDSHYIHQVINPGEMSKIFVQKTRADVLSTKMDEPNFSDNNLETIYIYRTKKC